MQLGFDLLSLSLIAVGALSSASAAALSSQDCDQYILAANELAKSSGIYSYRVYEGESVGAEIVDIIDLLDENGKFLGQVMGGIFREEEGVGGYVFMATDLVGEPELMTLIGGEHAYMYYDQKYVGQLKSTGETGPMEVTEDLGMKVAAHSIGMQAAVLSDGSLREALKDSPASQFEGLDGTDAEGGGYAAAAASEPCPIWVVTMACGTCVACVWVGEAPPPCWGACITCGACIGLVIPKPAPPDPNAPPPPRREPTIPTFASETLVHTPEGLTRLQDLAIGDTVLSLDTNGDPTVAKVIQRDIHEAVIGSLTYVGDEEIRAARRHMLMAPDGWIPAEKIGHGLVRSVTGEFVEVDTFDACSAEMSDTSFEVCRILVEGGTGYFIGTSGIYAEAR